jgi:hypothetical protein
MIAEHAAINNGRGFEIGLAPCRWDSAMVPPSSAQLPVPAIVEANNGAGIKQTDQRRPPR